ncbi:unnamed protein product [Camellia sinensis]
MSSNLELPMSGGDGANSYSKNSRYQDEAINLVKEMIIEAIAKKFDITSLSFSSNTIQIADLGCSVGPNTFKAMKSIVEAIEWKYHSKNLTTDMPEFQLFFNDHASNDFNTLFTTLPPDRQYFAAGVPGSFYGRLFPKSSIHLMYSSFALHWLSKVPEEMLDNGSLAWNKGKIHYTSASKEIANVYATQFAKDMDTFFNARADEIIVGGMMILIILGLADGVHYSQDPRRPFFDAFNQSLLDMVKLGTINEDEVDSFNLPLYSTTSPKEMTKLVERNGCFSIERMEVSDTRPKNDGPPNLPAILMHYRVILEGIFTRHFGSKIFDELFERTRNKFAEISSMLESSCVKGTQLFLVLKHDEAINVVKEMIKEAIAKKFDVTSLSFSSNTIQIADLGCSVGPNTFNAMKNILEAIEWKYHSKNLTIEMPEFQLFFNDHASNDFNTRSFYDRLFPKSSIHLMYSSFALHWLYKVELLDNGSLAWNKGKIHYTSASKEIANVYATQFAEDMDTFFNARADEIIGMINEDEVESFNLPLYTASAKEMTKLIERNGCFSIERMERHIVMESKAFPMNGGDGTYSYTKNFSVSVKTSSDSVKEMIKDAIVDKFDITSLSFSSNTIRIADLGCSVGPNTFIAMQNVLEAMEMKFYSQNVTSEMPEFQLFFSGNTLLQECLIHSMVGYSESPLFILYIPLLHSKVPEELLDKSCPAWNKGRIHYTSAPKEVINAYTTQFAKDMETFFNARADEIEAGGMMIVTLPALPNMHDHAHHPVAVLFLALEQSLVDMVKAGSISEDELDSFNLPLYSPSPNEMNQLVEKNGCFSMERMELTNPTAKTDGPSVNIPALIMHLRAGFEPVFTKHFGKRIIEELFERTLNKFAVISSQFEASLKNGSELFLVLKRK